MARLPIDPRLPSPTSQNYNDTLRVRLNDIFRQSNQQINQLTEGRIEAITNAYTAAPTSGEYKQGDFIRNSAPTELGVGGSKYVIYGFLCVVSGTPGTWVECRFLTGS